mgnify:CR=1 FL=1
MSYSVCQLLRSSVSGIAWLWEEGKWDLVEIVSRRSGNAAWPVPLASTLTMAPKKRSRPALAAKPSQENLPGTLECIQRATPPVLFQSLPLTRPSPSSQ